MDEDFEHLRENVFFGRTWTEMKNALAYTFWLMCSDDDGPTNRDEIEFIRQERNRVKMNKMHSLVKELKFESCLSEDDECPTRYKLDDSSESLLSGSTRRNSCSSD